MQGGRLWAPVKSPLATRKAKEQHTVSEKKRLQVHSEGMYCLTGTWALWDEQGPYARCSSSSSLPASRTNFKENVREGVQTPLVTSRQTGCLPRLSLESRPSSAAVVKLAGGKRGNKI